MPSYNIRGVTVRFPYAAYDCQIALMEKVIESLQNGNNALLESPTGTGKTLCLLCATLAWREACMARRQLATAVRSGLDADKSGFKADLLSQLDAAVSGISERDVFETDPPKIYYASRTHSQLSQAVSELRNSEYRPKICVLGSRDNMCINEEVLKAPSAGRGNICRQKIAKKACEYHANVETVRFQQENEILDIEELVKFGQTHSACPYFLSRANQSHADIIFLPYNYLIDAYARKAQNIDVKNGILIFDEGHNLESSCGDATSFEITPYDLTSCINEAQQCFQIASTPTFGAKEATADDFAILRNLLQRFESEIGALKLSQSKELILPGEYIYELFRKLEITFENVDVVLKVIEAGITMLAEESSRRSSRMALNLFATALKTVFKDGYASRMNELTSICRTYKVFVQSESVSTRDKAGWGGRGQQAGRKLSFWCFNSGIAMRDLVERGCRSVLLASGTLSPLDSFACEMNIPFSIRLENPHVIESHQVFVGVVPTGPAGIKLSSSYENRDSLDYIHDLGNSVVNFSRIVPDGFLVFFPSYGVMAKCLETWKVPSRGAQQGVMERISKYKEPIVEPRNKAEFGTAMEEFYAKLQDPKLKGAVFFAVCRGKASEGLDFSDTKGRAVMITGIPYPAAMDPKVKLKKQYLDEMHAEGKRRDGQSATLSGGDWYKQQAARAVNQALGRVIRHRKDYGAIILCDARFALPHNRNQLPVWVRPHVNVYKNFGEAQGQLGKFFRHMEEIHPRSALSSVRKALESSTNNGPSVEGHAAVMKHEVFRSINQKQVYATVTESQVEIKMKRARTGRKDAAQMWTELKAANVSTTIDAQPAGGPTRHRTTYELAKSTSYSTLPVSTLARQDSKPTLTRQGSKTRQLHPKLYEAEEKRKSTTITESSIPLDKRKRPLVDAAPDDESKTNEKRPADTLSERNEKKSKTRQSAQEYVEKVKRSVLLPTYRRFQEILRSYKAGTIDIKQLIDELIVIFGGDDVEEGVELIKSFHAFIPSRHKDLFQGLIRDFIKGRTGT